MLLWNVNIKLKPYILLIELALTTKLHIKIVGVKALSTHHWKEFIIMKTEREESTLMWCKMEIENKKFICEGGKIHALTLYKTWCKRARKSEGEAC